MRNSTNTVTCTQKTIYFSQRGWKYIEQSFLLLPNVFVQWRAAQRRMASAKILAYTTRPDTTDGLIWSIWYQKKKNAISHSLAFPECEWLAMPTGYTLQTCGMRGSHSAVLFSFVRPLQKQWDPWGWVWAAQGKQLVGEPTHLVIHLLLHLQRQHAACPWAQHVWAYADGKVVGIHPVGVSILADAVEYREQVLQQDQVWSGQFVSHPKWKQTERDVNSLCGGHYSFIWASLSCTQTVRTSSRKRNVCAFTTLQKYHSEIPNSRWACG